MVEDRIVFIFIFIFIIIIIIIIIYFTFFFFSCICITISSNYFFYIGDQFIGPYGFSGSLPLLFAMFWLYLFELRKINCWLVGCGTVLFHLNHHQHHYHHQQQQQQQQQIASVVQWCSLSTVSVCIISLERNLGWIIAGLESTDLSTVKCRYSSTRFRKVHAWHVWQNRWRQFATTLPLSKFLEDVPS